MMDHLALAGHAGAFPMTTAAKHRIVAYLAQARDGAGPDLDGDEVLRDLETDLGDHLRAALDAGSELDEPAVAAVLAAFGPLDVGSSTLPQRAPLLCRIDQGRMLSGLCLGLATRARVRVDWLRSIAVFLLLLSGGGLALVYLVALLFAPRIATAEQYRLLLDRDAARQR